MNLVAGNGGEVGFDGGILSARKKTLVTFGDIW
jgi:hypothetical protein